ncbi:hypothetical protein J2858_003917 [Neorhizobium galegae]|nr:hypothetical protein [Neorhizobium galegae]
MMLRFAKWRPVQTTTGLEVFATLAIVGGVWMTPAWMEHTYALRCILSSQSG